MRRAKNSAHSTHGAPYIRLRFESNRVSKSRSIVAAVKRELAAGRLPAGSRLPPVRVLSHQLGISKNTAQAAYEELAACGLIQTRARLGYFVAKHTAPRIVPRYPDAAPCSLAPTNMPIARRKPSHKTIELSSVFIDSELLPAERFGECMRAVVRHGALKSNYDLQGYAPLRAAIAKRLQQRGIPAQAEHLIITTGSQQALDIATRALRPRSIATENPAYGIGKLLFEMNQMAVTGLPVDPFRGIDSGQWREILARTRPAAMYLTSNYQNPTGYSYSTAELAQILELSREFRCGIVEDDWGSDMLSYSDFHPPLRALGGENVLYLNSFTKKLLPSLRLGYLLCNERDLTTLLAAKKVGTLANPPLIEIALHEFLDRGHYDTHLRALHAALDARYHACLATLEALMPPEVRWTTPGGGPILWLELPPSIDLIKLGERLLELHVAVETRSSLCFFGTPHLHGFKIGYAWLPIAAMQRGLEILAREVRRALDAGAAKKHR